MPLTATYRGRVDGALGSNVAVSGPIPCLAGDVFVVAVIADSYAENTDAAHVTVSLSTGWGLNHRADSTFFANVNSGAYAGVFAAVPVPANGSPVVTVTTSSAGPTTRRRPSFEMWTVTGYDTTSPVVGTGELDLWGNPINTSLTGAGRSCVIMAGGDGFKYGAPWITGDGVVPGWGWDQPGLTGVSGFSTAADWPGPAGSHWLTIDPPGGGPCPYALAVMEFRAAPVVPTVDAGVDRTVERTKGIIRTAGLTSDGGRSITARQWRLMSGPAGSGAPVDLAAYGGDPTRTLLPSAVAGVHVIRYTATNSVGPGYDEATITVTPLRPTVNAGADATMPMGVFTRTATEAAGDAAVTSRRWYVADGPSAVGSTIGTAAALSWTPPTLGRWTLGYTATSTAGTSDADTLTLTVGVTGVPLRLDRTPAPKLAVAIAFGGDLTDPGGSSWVFTEVTTDVRVAQGVHLRHGKGDEAGVSQPATCAFTLDNRSGKYSLGGRSPYWPNIRQGTPIQVSCDLGSGFQTLFTGRADGWTPSYTGVPLRPGSGGLGARGDATVAVSASGDLRRLAQGQPPVISPMRRGLVNAAGVVAYWPCEDGKDSRSIASAFPGAPAMDFSGRLHGGSNPNLPAASPKMAQSEVFVCSNPLPLVNDSEWYGTVPDYVATSIIQLRCLIDIPAAGSNDGAVLFGLITSGDPSFWEVRYKRGALDSGILNFRAWRNFTTLTGGADVDLTGVPLNGKKGQFGLTLTQSGSAVTWTVDFVEVGGTGGIIWPGSPGTITSATVGKAVRVQTATDGGHVDVTLGHIQVRNVARNLTENLRHLNAWSGEVVGERLVRLRDENVLWYTQYDPPPPYYPTVSDTMGPQPVGTVLDLFRDCEGTDRGVLWDGVGPGLSYTTKRYREAGVDGRGTPRLTLDAAAGQVGIPLTPVHDDAGRCNRAAVARRGGSNAVFEDATGPLGSGVVGRYEDSATVGVQSDAALVQYAGWAVGQGTVEGYRYPRLSLDLTAHPELLDEWLAVIVGDRVDVTNLAAVNPAAPDEAVSLAVEGFAQTIGSHTWDVQLNTSLYRRWQVACVCAETTGGPGDPRPEYAARVDTDGSVIAVLAAVGQATLTVTVTAGPAWTVNPDDYPLYLDVGGIAVRATGCTAPSGAQQTFGIDPMPVTRPAGTRVRLWNPPVYGL